MFAYDRKNKKMKQILQYSLLLVFTLATVQCYSRLSVKGIKKTAFYARPIYSEGAPRQIDYIDGNSTSQNKKYPSYQYFLYLQTDSKNLKINSLTIDNVNYTFQLNEATTPVTLDQQQGEKDLVVFKKSKEKVFKLDNLKEQGSGLADDVKPANLVIIKGTANGKAFTIRSYAKLLNPLVAQ